MAFEERVLIACASCHRQYDVSGMRPGERVRCECSQMLVVVARAARSPRPLKCGHCGGLLQDGARACAYCSAEISLEERGLSGVCPACCARLLRDARFCMECGVRIQPQALRPVAEGVFCPRCQGTLRARGIEGASFIECGSCAGLWLGPDVLQALCERAEKEEQAGLLFPDPGDVHRALPEDKITYIPCITCGDLMQRRNFGHSSGVIIDVCKKHGVWLDHRELERILDFVRSGGLQREREREVARMEARAERTRDLPGPSPAGWECPQDSFGRPWCDPSLGDALRWLGARLADMWGRP